MFLAVSLLNHCLPEAWWFTLQGSPPWNTCAKSGGKWPTLIEKKKKSDYKNKLINLQILKNKNTMTWLPVQPHKHICILGSIAVHEVQLAGEGRNRNTFKSTGAKHLVTSRDNPTQSFSSSLCCFSWWKWHSWLAVLLLSLIQRHFPKVILRVKK